MAESVNKGMFDLLVEFYNDRGERFLHCFTGCSMREEFRYDPLFKDLISKGYSFRYIQLPYGYDPYDIYPFSTILHDLRG